MGSEYRDAFEQRVPERSNVTDDTKLQLDGDNYMASRRMNRIMALLGISLAALLGGCGAAPATTDVVGSWVNTDGSELTIEENGHFTARLLPRGQTDGVRPWGLGLTDEK